MAAGLRQHEDGIVRCSWATDDGLYRRYHDEEWGRPVRSDTRLFEKLCLEGFQSGLSWLTILRKRGLSRRLCGFAIERVAAYGPAEVERLLRRRASCAIAARSKRRFRMPRRPGSHRRRRLARRLHLALPAARRRAPIQLRLGDAAPPDDHAGLAPPVRRSQAPRLSALSDPPPCMPSCRPWGW